ncbi:MAG: hypothetical protein JW867_05565 [Candidatus Omnitrophica bacterium]|nr:hypothetical protein [Candidatus Omnitrophota bacterium]
MIKKLSTLVLLILIFLLPLAFSQEKEMVFVGEGKYFTVYCSSSVDLASVLNKLKFTYLGSVDDYLSDNRSNIRSALVGAIDDLYLEVSDILDIHIYSYHGNLRFFPDQASVSSVFSSYLGAGFPERSFYLHPKNTIYISAQDVTLGMLGHEIAHAVISHYFVVPPPAKVQEVLCGYVEYTLLKKSN